MKRSKVHCICCKDNKQCCIVADNETLFMDDEAKSISNTEDRMNDALEFACDTAKFFQFDTYFFLLERKEMARSLGE